MATISKLRAGMEDDLEEQVARLAKEMSALKKSLSRRGESVYADTRETAADLYGDIRDAVVDALPHMRKRARAVERAAKDNPATAAVVGLIVVGLLVMLLARR